MTTPVTIAVRNATLDDCPALADANRLGQAAVVDARGGMLDTLLRGRVEPIDESFASDLDDPAHTILVATADKLVAGHAVAVHLPLGNGQAMLKVTDLWVHPQARRIGLGSALMQSLLSVAADLGCTGIDARALPGDRATKNFFESFGLVARTIEVHRAL